MVARRKQENLYLFGEDTAFDAEDNATLRHIVNFLAEGTAISVVEDTEQHSAVEGNAIFDVDAVLVPHTDGNHKAVEANGENQYIHCSLEKLT